MHLPMMYLVIIVFIYVLHIYGLTMSFVVILKVLKGKLRPLCAWLSDVPLWLLSQLCG